MYFIIKFIVFCEQLEKLACFMFHRHRERSLLIQVKGHVLNGENFIAISFRKECMNPNIQTPLNG
jgi:hypothetical protein